MPSVKTSEGGWLIFYSSQSCKPLATVLAVTAGMRICEIPEK